MIFIINLNSCNMKKTIQMIGVLIFLLALSNISNAQRYAKMDQSNSLSLNKESEVKEVQIKVSDEFNFLALKVECELTDGVLLVEILDPKGDIKENFSVVKNHVMTNGKSSLSGENVNGQIEKYFRNPIPGTWIIKITPNNASGKVKVFTTLIYNQRTDLLEIDEILKDTDSNF